MRYFVLSTHGGIGYLAALRILAQDPSNVCTFLVPFGQSETWTTDPLLRAYLASKAALVVTGDAKNLDDVQRAWHVAEMGIDSECSGIEAVIISDGQYLMTNSTHLTKSLRVQFRASPRRSRMPKNSLPSSSASRATRTHRSEWLVSRVIRPNLAWPPNASPHYKCLVLHLTPRGRRV